MVEKIKRQSKEALITADAIWNVLILVSQTAAGIVLAVYAMTLREYPFLLIATCAVACLLVANVLLTLFRLQRKVY
jgi:hypothetical protein